MGDTNASSNMQSEGNTNPPAGNSVPGVQTGSSNSKTVIITDGNTGTNTVTASVNANDGMVTHHRPPYVRRVTTTRPGLIVKPPKIRLNGTNMTKW